MFEFSKEEIEDIINSDINKLYPRATRDDDVYVEVTANNLKRIELILYRDQKPVRMDTIPFEQFIGAYNV